MKFRAINVDRIASLAIAHAAESAPGLFGWRSGVQRRGGGHMTALVVGLVSIVVVWLIVICGSIYVNKNVQ
jgi:hypothetical protein